jgi:hypothetical protein
VVAVGETVFEPDATGVTEPMLLSIENVVAFVVVHESEEEPPEAIEAGLAESVHEGLSVVAATMLNDASLVSAVAGRSSTLLM